MRDRVLAALPLLALALVGAVRPAPAAATLDERVAIGQAWLAAGHAAKGTALLQAVLAEQPGNVQALMQLGMQAAREGRVGDAQQAMQAIEDRQPGDPVVAYNLAMLALRRNDTKLGRRWLERYLKLAPAAPDRAQMEALLQRLPR